VQIQSGRTVPKSQNFNNFPFFSFFCFGLSRPGLKCIKPAYFFLVLDLSGNALSELPLSLLTSLTGQHNSTAELTQLDLGSNPWNCSCSLLQLAHLLRYSEPVFLNVYGTQALIPRNKIRQPM
jgi:hypothetical protein